MVSQVYFKLDVILDDAVHSNGDCHRLHDENLITEDIVNGMEHTQSVR